MIARGFSESETEIMGLDWTVSHGVRIQNENGSSQQSTEEKLGRGVGREAWAWLVRCALVKGNSLEADSRAPRARAVMNGSFLLKKIAN